MVKQATARMAPLLHQMHSASLVSVSSTYPSYQYGGGCLTTFYHGGISLVICITYVPLPAPVFVIVQSDPRLGNIKSTCCNVFAANVNKSVDTTAPGINSPNVNGCAMACIFSMTRPQASRLDTRLTDAAATLAPIVSRIRLSADSESPNDALKFDSRTYGP